MIPWPVETLADPVDAADPAMLDWLAVRDAVLVDVWGNDDLTESPRSRFVSVHDRRDRVRVVLLVRDGAHPVGAAEVQLHVHDNLHSAAISIDVVPDARRRGVGGALLAEVLRVAAAHGCDTVQTEVDHLPEPGPDDDVLRPPTGSGLARASDPGVGFLTSHGFELGQVDRASLLRPPVDPAFLADYAAVAARVAEPGYRLAAWRGAVPERWVDDYAVLHRAMSTDPPLGEMDWRPEVWDAARVRAVEDRMAVSGDEPLVVGAVHAPSGRLVGMTMFLLVDGHDEFCWQGDTIVAAEHRGHRLGAWMKAENLRRLAAEQPRIRRVVTFNAEENAHMLGINVALGFRPLGSSSCWQRRLAS